MSAIEDSAAVAARSAAGALIVGADERRPTRAILHVAAPAQVGGLESVLQLLAVGQRRRGDRVIVAAILARQDASAPWRDRLRAAGVAVEPIAYPGRSYVSQARALVRLFRRERPALVHTHGYHADVVGGLAARRVGVPTVTTVHGFTGGGWKNWFYERLQRRAFRRFDAVVAVSHAMKPELERGGVPAARLYVVPNAFAADVAPVSRAEARSALGLGAGGVRVGWVGRLSAEKGADVVISAFARLGPHVRLSVIGDGAERGTLDRLARRLGVRDRITWHGVVPDAGRLLAAFDVVVLSSRSEGTPMVLLEAMAAGAPVVATRVGGIPDVVSSAEALLVEPEDPRALAAAITTTLADGRAAAARAAAARERLARDFAVDPWLDRIDAVYDAVARRPG
jgi:glycosyltransferase involved in cell wall biosynthesis